MKNDIVVSVIVLTYNSSKERLYKTLESIVRQQNINIEIIISDDGSKDNLKVEIIDFMKNKMFKQFVLVENTENKGTVINSYAAITRANGKFVKFLCPGDYFVNDYILYNWVEFLEKSGKIWSYSNFKCYYTKDNVEKQDCKQLKMPVCTNPYKAKNDKRCRIYYSGLADVANAAASICKKDYFQEYLERILGKIIYAEDCVYRLMTFDGHVPAYYEVESIYYETKCGISTNGQSKWQEMLIKDCTSADEMMLNDANKCIIKDNIKKLIKKREQRSLIRLLWSIEWRLFG